MDCNKSHYSMSDNNIVYNSCDRMHVNRTNPIVIGDYPYILDKDVPSDIHMCYIWCDMVIKQPCTDMLYVIIIPSNRDKYGQKIRC